MMNEPELINIPGYPAGSDITIMNVLYERPRKNPETNKYDTDYATIVFKDNKTGEKKLYCMGSPRYRYYLKKPQYSAGLDYNAEWCDINQLDACVCEYRNLKKDIATRLGYKDVFMNNIQTGNYKANDLLVAHPRVFGADLPIINFIRAEFAAKYTNRITSTSKAYYDIESDIKFAVSEKQIVGECPVNAISIYFDKTNCLYSFLLKNPLNPQIAELEQEIKGDLPKATKTVNDFLAELHGEEKLKKYGLVDIKLVIGFFDTEVDLIIAFFSLMKKLSPDFAIAYNAAYDLRSLYERLLVHGIDPIEVICDEDAARKFFVYHVEETDEYGKFKPFEERGDYVQCATRITWLDQLIIYASRRKGRAAIESNKLDFVVDQECGMHKTDWSPYAKRFADFCYNNYKMFWLYNLNDTIVQHALERQVNDIDFVFSMTVGMNSPYQKIFRQTNYLISKLNEFYKQNEGVIAGININKFAPKTSKKDREKFPGAFVADPLKITDRNKVVCSGSHIMKFYNADDFDYKSLYPSLIREFNMAISTMIGRIFIEEPPYKGDASLRIGNGGHFVENLASYNIIEFSSRWLHLRNVEGILNDLNYYFTHLRTPRYKGQGNLPMDKSHILVMHRIDPHKPMACVRPIPDWVKAEVNNIRERIFKSV